MIANSRLDRKEPINSLYFCTAIMSETSSTHQNPKTDSRRSDRITSWVGRRAVGPTCGKVKAYTAFVGSMNFCCGREQYSCSSRLSVGHRDRIAPYNVLSNVFRFPQLSSLNGHSFCTGTLHEALPLLLRTSTVFVHHPSARSSFSALAQKSARVRCQHFRDIACGLWVVQSLHQFVKRKPFAFMSMPQYLNQGLAKTFGVWPLITTPRRLLPLPVHGLTARPLLVWFLSTFSSHSCAGPVIMAHGVIDCFWLVWLCTRFTRHNVVHMNRDIRITVPAVHTMREHERTGQTTCSTSAKWLR